MTKPSARSWTIYLRLLAYLRPYRARFLCALAAMAVYGATDGAIPYVLKRVLDDIFGAQNERMLWLLVWTIIAFAVVRGIFGFLERYLIATVGLNIIRDLRNAISAHLLKLSDNFYSGETSGSLLSRMTNDVLLVKTVLSDVAGSILRDSVRVIALLVVAIYLDPVLGIIAFVGFPLALYPVFRFGKNVKRLSRKGQDQFGGLTALMQEMVLGHRVVQSFNQEGGELARFQRENESITNLFRRAEKYGALSTPVNEVLGSLAIAAVILYGGFSVISGVRTQGDFIAFITSMFLLYEPLKKIGRMNTAFQVGISAAERIFEILDTEPGIIERLDALELKTSRSQIRYENVSFRYPLKADGEPEEIHPALSRINLDIAAGETVALVGMSGGGKTTLVSLLPRFYDPAGGAIFIDGRDIRDYTLRSLRESIAIVNQHTFLFNQDVRYNIAYGKPDASDSEIAAAAQAANAHEFIMRLPDGYRTVIGEQGLRLSGGERSRIAIARALLKNSPILILDEATASLDSESENLVQQAIDTLMENRTTLVIAHRLSTVRRASRIAVLKRGELVELGTHDELLKAGGEYSKLYRLQFRKDDVVGM